MRRSKVDVFENMKKQLTLLKSNIDMYDKNNEVYAISLSAIIRTLVHDSTKKSVSVLKQVNVKHDCLFSSNVYNQFWDRNVISYSPFLNISFSNQKAIYKPAGIKMENGAYKMLFFDDWWNELVCRFSNKYYLSRKNVVKILSDKSGGTHLDPTLTQKEYLITSTNALGWRSGNGVGKDFDNSCLYAMVRQIAEELYFSLMMYLLHDNKEFSLTNKKIQVRYIQNTDVRYFLRMSGVYSPGELWLKEDNNITSKEDICLFYVEYFLKTKQKISMFLITKYETLIKNIPWFDN